jgi:hypothetical protein
MTVLGHIPASVAVPSKRGAPVTHLIELSVVHRFCPNSVLQIKTSSPPESRAPFSRLLVVSPVCYIFVNATQKI